MSDRKTLGLLFLIMAVTAIAVGGIAIGILYVKAAEERGAELARAVGLQLDALAPLAENAGAGAPGTGAVAAMARDRDIHRALGREGSILIGRSDGDAVVLLAADPRFPAGEVKGTAMRPFRLALAGGTGVIRTVDGREAQVLAAYAADPARSVAVVAQVAMASIRAPFLNAATVMTGCAVILIAVATFLFSAITDPILQRARAGEERFRELFENMRSGAVVYRPVPGGDTFVAVDVNRSAERIEGLPRAQLLARRAEEIFPGLRRIGLLEAMLRVARTGAPEHCPAALYQDDRITGWREHYVYRLPSGEVVVLYDDVTDRRQAEEALRDSEARWRSIIEMQSVAIVIVDHKHEIRFVNKAAEALFAQTAQSLVGVPFGYPVVQGDVAEIEVIRPGRGLAFAEMRAIPMRWSGQDHFLLFIQDVSAYKRAQGDLRKLFQAIEQSPVSVVITDVQGKIEYVNPKFAEATGYTYSEVVGKNPRILKSGAHPPEHYRVLWEMITTGQVWRGEFYNRRKNGEQFWELASIAPVRDAAGRITHHVAVKEDITERKATEERLRLSQRMEVIGQLTGGLAHDFNNLLAIILGNLQLLEEKPELDPETRELIADAIWSAERGAQLTHRLLAFARRQRLNPKATDLNEVVAEMTDLLRRTLGDRIEIREILAQGLWPTMIDRGQLESALLNLVVNARDAMAEGGVLTVATANTTLDDVRTMRTGEVPAGEYVTLTVTDTGIGMAPEILERIFEPFFTTKAFGQGSGLGLSMVYGFVRQTGGHIDVGSEVGLGTTVRLYLPRAYGDEDREPRVQRRPAAAPAGNEVILVVEDDERVRKTTVNVLKRRGYDVVAAGDGREALGALEALARLDLLFTDVVLPNGMNGTQLAQQVMLRRPATRILFTSGYATEAVIGEDLSRQGIDLIPKPYDAVDLAHKVREILDRVA